MSIKQTKDEAIVALHGAKSNLLMEAQMLIGTGNPDEAMERFAHAAPMEVRLAAFYKKQGEPLMAARHRLSAAICYAKSGNLREAIKLYDALGRDRNTPGQFKAEAALSAARLRQQHRETLQGYGHSLQSAA